MSFFASEIRNYFFGLYQVRRMQNENEENLLSADSDVYNSINILNSSSFQLEL